MVYSFGGQNSPNALPTIEEESEEPESLENIEFPMEHRDAVTMSDEDGPEGSSQEDGGSTEYQFKLHLSAREQETARNSIFYNWMKPEIAYSRQILNTYLNVLKKKVPATTYLMDMNDFKFLCSHEDLSTELMSDYFYESLAEKRLLVVPCESENGIVQIAESTLEPTNHASVIIVDTEKKVIQLADSSSMLYDAKNEKSSHAVQVFACCI